MYTGTCSRASYILIALNYALECVDGREAVAVRRERIRELRMDVELAQSNFARIKTSLTYREAAVARDKFAPIAIELRKLERIENSPRRGYDSQDRAGMSKRAVKYAAKALLPYANPCGFDAHGFLPGERPANYCERYEPVYAAA